MNKQQKPRGVPRNSDLWATSTGEGEVEGDKMAGAAGFLRTGVTPATHGFLPLAPPPSHRPLESCLKGKWAIDLWTPNFQGRSLSQNSLCREFLPAL